jgi:RNA polymerase sigma-70 factor, ECF subfamily
VKTAPVSYGSLRQPVDRIFRDHRLRSMLLFDDPTPSTSFPGGDASTAGLVTSLYGELVAMAHRILRTERDDHTLETSALVHEAFLRLATQHASDWQSRSYFLGAAANTMRRVLVDYARARGAEKRDGGVRTTLVSFPDRPAGGTDVLDVLALDDVLARLATLDARQAHVVELRVFGGFEVEEVAEIVGVSPRTVKRDWRFAKAWLTCQLIPAA